MIAFSKWLKIRESSASTRLKTQAALGLAPPVADIFGHSTPPPWQVKRLMRSLKKRKRKKKKSKIHEASKPKLVDRNIDSFLAAVERLAKDLWELKRLKKLKKSKEVKDKIKKIVKSYDSKIDDIDKNNYKKDHQKKNDQSKDQD